MTLLTLISTSNYDVDLEIGCQRPVFEIEIEVEIEIKKNELSTQWINLSHFEKENGEKLGRTENKNGRT